MLAENRPVPTPRLIRFEDASYAALLAEVKSGAASNLDDAQDYADEKDAETLQSAKNYADEKDTIVSQSVGTLASDSLKILTTAELTSAVTAMENGTSFFYLDSETRTLGRKAKDAQGEVTDTVIGKLATE